MNKPALQADSYVHLAHTLAQTENKPYTSHDVYLRAKKLRSHYSGLGQLDHLLYDPSITDVCINSKDGIWVDRGKGMERIPGDFSTDSSVRELANTLARRLDVRLDEAQCWCDGVFSASSDLQVRVNIVIPPISLSGTCISLRFLRNDFHSLATLHSMRMLSDEAHDIIRTAIARRENILISGETGSGKTTLLQAILAESPQERIITLEESAEISPISAHHVRLVATKNNCEGVGEIPMRDLVKQSLRMRPDRLYLGEVRGAEMFDLLCALNTGHCAGATIHANSLSRIPARISALSLLAGLSENSITEQVRELNLTLIHVQRNHGRNNSGQRNISGIARLQQGSVQPVWEQAC